MNNSTQLFVDNYYEYYSYIEHYTAKCIYRNLSRNNNIDFVKGVVKEDIEDSLKVADNYKTLLVWALNYLVQIGTLLKKNNKYYKNKDYVFPHKEQPHSVNIQPSINMINFVSLHWNDFLSNNKNPILTLFSEEGEILWESYFSNNHFLYAPYNKWAAKRIIDILEPGNVEILEIGSGYGSGSDCLINDIENNTKLHLKQTVISDISKSLISKIKNTLEGKYKNKNLSYKTLDMNKIDPNKEGKFDVVFGINAFHCADNIKLTLSKTKQLLKRNGNIVISECTKDNYNTLLHQEYIFSFLPNFNMVNNNLASPTFGFLTNNDWFNLLKDVGFKDIMIDTNQKNRVIGSIISAKN